jgi:tetratricopeptide (TPR) repeat protein
MNAWLRFSRACALAGCLGLLGCATFRPGGLGEAADPEVRPNAPPEYDLLVAQQHAFEGRIPEALAAYQRAVAKDDSSAYLHRKVAAALAQQNRLDESIDHATRAVELEPDDLTTRIFLARLYQLRGDVAAADQVLTDESGEPINTDAAFLLYQVYLTSGRLDEALATAEWLVEHESDEARGAVALANVYQRMDRPGDVERSLRRALALEPDNTRIYGALARTMRDRGDHAGELAVYRELLARYPHHRATLVALADAQMNADDLEGAIVTLEEVERHHPDDVDSVVRLGFLKYEARDFHEAADRFERALAEHPERYEVAFFLGVVRRRMGDADAAIAAFERIPPEHRHYSESRTQIAALLERRGDYEGALREVEKAATVRSTRPLQLFQATLRSKNGDFEGAVRYLEKLIEEEPSDDELLYNLGVVYGEAKRTDEALEYMLRALELNPDNASALNYVGYSWAEKGIRLDEAEELIVRAIELRPDDGYVADSLGWVYYMRARALVDDGREREARRHLERALRELQRADELTGGDPVVSEHLGDTYLLLDQKKRALDKFEEAVRQEPREGEQPHLLEKLETLQHELR